MGSEPLAIEIRNVTKRFRRRTVRGGYTTFKTQLVGLLTRKRREQFELQNIEVLKGIDLLVPQGRTIGIIGENGSGKSTLLKILTGIYSPSSGTSEVRGRISALLELGAGFHPDFSGRENIFVNGVILGLTKAEIRQKLEEIIAFSELGDFIDEPVRTYSSGMYMRLAFAVATFVDPDVLIIDEILSVGDDHFMRKSRAKMEEFKKRGKTIVLVTHDLGTVESWCDMAAWIEKGRIAAVGEPRQVVAAYRQRVAEKETRNEAGVGSSMSHEAETSAADAPDAQASSADPQPSTSGSSNRWGNRAVTLHSVRLLDGNGQATSVFGAASPMTIEMDFEATANVVDVAFGIGIFREDGLQVYGTNTLIEALPLPAPLPQQGRVRFVIDELPLGDGNFLLDVAAHSAQGLAYDYQKGRCTFAVRSSLHDVGVARLKHRWEISALPQQSELKSA